MTIFYSTELAGIASTPVVKASATAGYGARLRRYRATITLASQATTDTIMVAMVPAGLTFAYGVLTTSVTLGTSTVAIGVTGTTAKYKASGTFTAVDTPTMFGVNTAVGQAALTAEDQVFITIGTAALPASGTLVVDLYFSTPT